MSSRSKLWLGDLDAAAIVAAAPASAARRRRRETPPRDGEGAS
jgi:hypothetical protein